MLAFNFAKLATEFRCGRLHVEKLSNGRVIS